VAWYRAHAAWWQEILSGDYRSYYERQYGAGSQMGTQGVPE
jgi:dTDP-D-glucose 4,6-dehydratase